MNLVEQFNEIIEWQKSNNTIALVELNGAVTGEQIEKIEMLLEEKVPVEFRQLYLSANGQALNSDGVFLGHEFMSALQIIQQLELSRSFIKPANPVIENPTKSKELLDRVAAFYFSHAPKRNRLGFKKSWYKMQFVCSPGAFVDPSLFATPATLVEDSKTIAVEDYELIRPVVQELYELEKAGYNWDELHFSIFSNGDYNVTRAYYDFDNTIHFTSTPNNAIKKKYFHHKWLPLFSDGAGNYLGIDLDPDSNGVKGQVINFGRDEEDMFVFAEDLNEFFQIILANINGTHKESFRNSSHLHDTLKQVLFK